MTLSLPTGPLVELPGQPEGVPWPTDVWPVGAAPGALTPLLDAMMSDTARFGTTYATVVVHAGRLVAERYGSALEHWDRDPEPVTASTRLLSWSKAKSILHAAVGILVGEGRLDLDAPAPVPEWSDAGDPRRAITLEQLLTMRDGLDFLEDYVDADRSDVIDMLFGSGQHDVARHAANRALIHSPGEHFNYSSGTSNIVSGVVAREVGPGREYELFLRKRLFDPVGMRTAQPRFDDAGTFIGSSYVYATAQDFARFGYLYLRGGVWDGVRVLPDGWVDHGRRARSVDEEDGRLHGAHWWVVGDDLGTFWANGYEGQSTLVCPALDVVLVRLGKSRRDQYPALFDWRRAVVDVLRDQNSSAGSPSAS
jgi:CubicO group peptidase (beta-lactamase class C family)